MFYIFEFLTHFIYQHRSSACDDFVDRLNRKYTVILILVFVTVLTSKQYIGEPLACFCPAHFTGAHVEYTNNICWISKAFYVPIESTSFILPTSPSISASTASYSSSSDESSPAFISFNRNQLKFIDDFQFQFSNTSHLKFARVDNLIAYYPFLLIAQAIFFYFPYFIWKNIINRSAYDIGTLIYIAYESQTSETQIQREKTLRYLIKHLDRANEYYSNRNDLKRTNFTHRKTSSKDLSFENQTYDDDNNNNNSEMNNNNIFRFDWLSNLLRSKKIRKKFNQKETNPLENSSNNNNNNNSIISFSPFNTLLFTIYLIVKLAYILNCIGQFLILNKFISGQNKTDKFYNENNEYMRSDLTYLTNKSLLKGFEFGYKSIANLIESGSLFNEKNHLLIFHTVIFCDFRIRMLGDRLHRYTIQCVVPVNIYTEKIFTVLWFWFLLLNFINVYNFIVWLIYYFSLKARTEFIIKHLLKLNDLKATNLNDQLTISSCLSSSRADNSKTNPTLLKKYNNKKDSDINLIDKMIKNYLIHDNIFIVKLISKNTNEMITRELVTLLFENYKRKSSLFYDENTV